MKISMIKEKQASYFNVNGYNPFDHIEILCDEITGEPIRNPEGTPLVGLRVKHLMDWFHKFCHQNGTFGAIHVNPVEREDGVHEFHARVYLDYKDASLATEANPDAGSIGSGNGSKEPLGASKYEPYASAQTKAIATALKDAGFGTEVEAVIVSSDQSEENAELIIIDDEAKEPEKPVKAPEVKVPSFKVPDDVEDAKETDNEDAEVDYKDVVPEKKAKAKKSSKKTKSEPAEEETPEPVPETTEEVSAPEKEEKPEEPAETSEPETAEEPEEASDAGEYIITTDDITPCPGLLMEKVGQPISVLGKETAEKLLQAFGSEFNETFLEELNAYVGG